MLNERGDDGTRLRRLWVPIKNLAKRLDDLEKKWDGQFKILFDSLQALAAPPVKPKRKIGFDLKEKQARYGRNNRTPGPW